MAISAALQKLHTHLDDARYANEDGKAMSKSKQSSWSNGRARAPRDESKKSPEETREDECCALLRGHPIPAPASAQRRRRAHENGEDKRT